jgi:hypothetical protein
MKQVQWPCHGCFPWLSKVLRVVMLGVCLGLVMLQPIAPAQASIHTYHEQPGQTTLRSRQSLRDQNDLAWQATLFKRYQASAPPALYLRLVGFPGQITIAPDQDLQITTGTLVAWNATPSLDAKTNALPANVGQYRVDQVLNDLQVPIPLTLLVPLQNGANARLVVAPFVVEEWVRLKSTVPEGI